MTKKNVHVVKSKSGEVWSVKTENSQKAYRNVSTQQEAIEIGKNVAKSNGSELLIHGVNGKIREKNSYGDDKHPPIG
ncbi:DUF2188 domain-containing protein [Flavobacterium sp. ZT3R18]|uniref:DUF2188 domain-containing protein n=1 Tax=Flavobacterium sp. ZT3R18 TaxID=2594429 RepID=UPI00117A757F|nr:DUF2188 domain-containing protein [Flavobacterium sp. ZT3R18]TRX34991.1 DUF2188 domain-containing protein [Flavobacterium sp. ZT3R18]